jgi:radical SAM superfamily enzyme YgiQ (UPF0313 family)
MPDRPLTFCGLTAVHPEDRSHYQPLWIGYLAAFARERLPHLQVMAADSAEEAITARPDVVGVSASSVNVNAAVAIARRVREALDVPLVLGGPHVTALPHTLPAPFDVGVRGEGELTFVDLMRLRDEQGRFEPDALAGIDGLAYRAAGAVKLTAPRATIADLSTVPPPDRSLLRGDFATAHVVSSRGCPYRCRFCASRAMWGEWRAFPAAHVLAELDDVIERRGAREVHFFDDLFVADLARLMAIADGAAARGWPGRVRFSCTLRAELAREEVFAKLARLGVSRVTFGAESQSPTVLRWLKGEGADIAANQRALDLARRHGMTCSPSFIKGAPGETGDDLLATYEFILRGVRERKIDYFEMHCLTPFPGSEIWDIAKTRGLVADDMDFDELRTPWERQYLNEAMPKTSFYFFENLNAIATRWLGMNRRRAVALIDVSHGDAALAELLADLRERGIFDETLVVRFHGEVEVDAWRAHGVKVGGLDLLAPYLAADDPTLLVVYMRPEAGVSADAANRVAWFLFQSDADVALHSAFRHFTPATPFERSLAAGNQRGLRGGLREFPGAPGALERMEAAGLKVITYRPDDDPFAGRTATTRLFVETLRRDFGIDRPWPGRERMQAAVEERIVTDAARLPAIEARRRRRRRWREAARAAWRRLSGPRGRG